MPELKDFRLPILKLEQSAQRASNELDEFISHVRKMPWPYQSEGEIDQLVESMQLMRDIVDSYLDGLRKQQGLPLKGTPVCMKRSKRRMVVLGGSVDPNNATRFNEIEIRCGVLGESGINFSWHRVQDLEIKGEPLLTYDAQMKWLENGTLQP